MRLMFHIAAMLFALVGAPTQAAPYELVPSPGWVVSDETLALETPRAPDGLTYLLRDEQSDVRADGWSEYFRIAYRIDARGRLEYGARFEVEFHPDYQRVEIHHVLLLRGDQVIERASSIRAELMRREDELERDILTGVNTLNVLIPDVRVGDVVDVAYTVHGSNPVFAGGYHDTFVAAFSAPLVKRRIRIRHPVTQRLYWKVDSEDYAIEESRDEATAVVAFTATDLPARTRPDDAPSWYGASGEIQVSTHDGWREVAEWALPRMRGRFQDERVATEMRAMLDLGAPQGIASVERTIAFVQREIRYTGLSLGSWTHTAYPPEQTLARRYGDCKDKATLLIALLALADIEAWPVLVDTDRRATIATHQPSPLAFDHVVVKVRLDGHDYWIDPTRAEEHGPLATRSPLPFAVGLPVATGSDGLVEIPFPATELPEVDVEQTIAIADVDGRKLADFTVLTVYRGVDADRIVDQFESNAAAEIGEQYRAYMDDRYAGIEQVGEPEIFPRAGDGSVSVSERYRWAVPEDGSRYFSIDLFQVGDWLPNLVGERQAPLALTGPRHGRQRVLVSHAGGWSITPEDESSTVDEFRLDRTVTVEGGQLAIDARWQRFSDAISAERLGPTKAAVERNWELQSFTLDFGAGFDTSEWLTLRAWGWPFAAFAFTGAFVVVGRMRSRGDLLGMLFAPRETVARALQSANSQPMLVLLLCAGALVAIPFDQGAEFALNPGAREFGSMIGAAFGGVLQSLFAVALAALGMRLVGRSTAYRRLLVAYAWASVPALGLLVAAAIAVGGRFSLFAESAETVPVDVPAVFTAAGLALAAVGWMLVALVNGYAQAAGTTRRRALAGFVLGIALFVFAIVLVVIPFR